MEKLIRSATGSFIAAFRFSMTLTYAATAAVVMTLVHLGTVDAEEAARTAPLIGAGITTASVLFAWAIRLAAGNRDKGP